MQIWVGLGNPGDKYKLHRHNVGFMAADVIAEARGFGPWTKKFRSLVCDAANIPNEIHIPLDGLEIGDSIHISQVKLPKGAKAANADDDFTVATIVAPSAMKQTEEEAAAAEGEVPTVGDEEAEGEAEGGEAEGGDEV